MNLLIIEDDIFLANKIKQLLNKKKLLNRITLLYSFKDFLNEFYLINSYDIVLVDILLGKESDNNGIDIIKKIRTKNFVIPIIVISGLNDIGWLKSAFDMGASDYICKPFRLAELEIRILKWFNKFLSNNNLIDTKFIEYGFLKYDFSKNMFFINNEEVILSKGNKYLLLLFISQSEKLLTNIYLIEKIWGDSNLIDRNLRLTISRLKKSLEKYKIDDWIINIRGEGYMFKKYF